VLAAPESAGPDAVRQGVLVQLQQCSPTSTADYLNKAVDQHQERRQSDQLKKAAIVPDMKKRGAVRSIYDGRVRVRALLLAAAATIEPTTWKRSTATTIWSCSISKTIRWRSSISPRQATAIASCWLP